MLKLFVFFSLLLSSAASLAQIQPFTLDEDNSQVNIGVIGDYLLDETKMLTLTQLTKSNYSSQFLPLNNDFLQLPIQSGNYWIRARLLINDSHPINRVIKIQAPRLQELDLYIPQIDINKPIAQLGELRSSYSAFLNAGTLIPLPETENGAVDLYFKLSSPTPVNAAIDVLPVTEADQHNKLEFMINGIVIGLTLVMLLANFSLFVFSKNTMYFLYCLVLLMTLIVHWSIHGYFTSFLPELDHIQLRIYNVAALIGTMSLVLFSRYYLNTKNALPEIDMILVAIALINGIFALLYGIFPYFLSVIYLSIFLALSSLFLSILGVIASIKRIPYANFFLTAQLITFPSYCYWILNSFGVVSNPFYYFWGISFTMLTEAFIFLLSAFSKIHSFDQQPLIKTENILYRSQIFEMINDLTSRMRRQTNIISGSVNEISYAPSQQVLATENIEQANRNLEHVLERLDNLNNLHDTIGKSANNYIYVEDLIEDTLNQFHDLDQDQIHVVVKAQSIPKDEQVNQARLLRHLLLILLLEFKNFSDQTLTITLKKRVNSQEGISYLDVVITPVPRHISEENDERLNLGLGYIHYLINQLSGKVLQNKAPQGKQFYIRIPARYRLLDRKPETNNLQACQLFILGDQSHINRNIFNILQDTPISVIQAKNITELSQHEIHKTPAGVINLIILLEHSGYIPQLMIRQIKPLLRVEDQSLLISDNIKMPKGFALTLGFDELIHAVELDQYLKTTIVRLTEKGLRLQKATLL